jgi:diguanylate cyclase (GGDEF)-like protein
VPQRLERERRRVGLAFGVIAAAVPALTLIPPGRGLLAPQVGLYSVVVAAILAVGVRDWHRIVRRCTLVAVAYVVVAALLRDAEGGGASGFAPLFQLPIFWVSFVGRHRDLQATLAAVTVALVAPILLVGAPDYPSGEWRRAIVFLTVTPVIGLATLRLRMRSEDARAAVEHQARTDPLTGLPNRRGLTETLAREVARAGRTGSPLALALLDLDHFKRFNDERGHATGDELLAAAATSWSRVLRETDLLARWGGEEFVVVLPDTTPDAATTVLDRLRAATPMDQTCSVGVVAVDLLAELPVDDALRRADAALYVSKEAGRDRVTAA